MKWFFIFLTVLIVIGYYYQDDIKQAAWRLEMNTNAPLHIGD